MKKSNVIISRFLSIAILLATLLPALHSLSHKISFGDKDISSVHFSEIDVKADCDLCTFHLVTSDFPEFYSYTLYTPLKEEIYIISLRDKVNLFPFRLFQLRAPPVLIG